MTAMPMPEPNAEEPRTAGHGVVVSLPVAPAPTHGDSDGSGSKGTSWMARIGLVLSGVAIGSLATGGVAHYAPQEADTANAKAVATLSAALTKTAKQRDKAQDDAASAAAMHEAHRAAAATAPAATAAAPAAAATAPAAKAAAPAPKSVAIAGFAFSPAALTVKKGTTVTWTNNDTAPHSIASSFFNSPMMNKGGRASHTFNQVGTFSYQCGPHPSMKATITVTA